MTIEELKAENARLEADNDRLKEAISDSYKAVDEMEQRFKALEAEFETHPMAAENARLKAEVERLELEVFAFDRTIKQASCHYDNRLEDIRQLQAEVERLTKAANEAAHAWSVYENGLIETPEWVKRSQVRDAISRLWNAAKEGKPRA